MKSTNRCGLWCFHPTWLQNFATSRIFFAVYGLLGTVQSMAFIYIVVSLTTLEKRFKIPSRTTGIILSGNEISQILSIFLIYYGGAGHRPRWIATGVFCSALSCFVLALPHFIYGPGQDALALTREYLDNVTAQVTHKSKNDLAICSTNGQSDVCDPEEEIDGTRFGDTGVVPRLLVFFSQFILGIGTTLYYGLGQIYVDDNTKKKNMPVILGFTFALRTVGPALGFILSYVCLNIYIDPSLTPVIAKNDPRWLGAWWLGWIILGLTMSLFSALLSMFPRELEKVKKTPEENLSESEVPLKSETISTTSMLTNDYNSSLGTAYTYESPMEKPTLKEFPRTVGRIIKNKLLMINIFSGVFYILSAAPFMSFIAKYLEVQFQTSAGGGSMLVGPITLLGMVLGFVISGLVIGKFRPLPRPLLFWNVLVGLCYVFGQISFMFLGCTSSIQGVDMTTMTVNLTSTCNAACNCEGVKYAPVCHEPSMTTYFSACHAGCQTSFNGTFFGECACVPQQISVFQEMKGVGNVNLLSQLDANFNRNVTSGPCRIDCFTQNMLFIVVLTVINVLGCSGKIGNVLVNYRSVETRDKSLAQGIALMVISLLGLIPGPIIFGAIMDSTCLIWNVSCGKRGNCWFYHTDNFRYYVNLTSACLCIIGVIFDVIVCYLSKGLDLYGDNDEITVEKNKCKQIIPSVIRDNKLKLPD